MSQLSIAEDMYQRCVDRDDMGYRGARRDDYEDRLDREYLERDDHYGQPPRQRDVRLTMRGLPKPSNSDQHGQPPIRRDERRTLRGMRYQIIADEITKESSSHLGETHGSAPVTNINGQIRLEEVQEVTKMATQLMAQNAQLVELNMQQARTISELREQLSQLASAISEMQDAKEKLSLQAIQPPISNVNVVMVKNEEHLDEDSMELNEEATSEEVAQVLTFPACVKNVETCVPEDFEKCTPIPVSVFQIAESNSCTLETSLLQDSMERSNAEADRELWELFSKVEILLGGKVMAETVKTMIDIDSGTPSIETKGEVVNSSIHISIQPPSNNAEDHSLLTVDELKPLPEQAKTKNVGKRRRSPRKKKSSKAQEVQYKEKYYYKRNVRKAPTKIIFGKVYNLPVKVKQKSFWIAKSCNFTLTNVGLEKELRLAQLRELRRRDKESHQDYLARAKAYYKKLGVTTWSVQPGKPVINS